MSVESVRWLVSGRVQGVGFRWFVERAAVAFGVDGDVRNLPDGSVEIRAAGSRQALERLLERVAAGPPGARVERVVNSEWTPDVKPRGFATRF